jgi:hypothetical protein
MHAHPASAARRQSLPAHLIGVGLHILDRLQRAQRLVHAAAKGQVVDGGMLHDTLLVDDEQAAESDACFGAAARGEGGHEQPCVPR